MNVSKIRKSVFIYGSSILSLFFCTAGLLGEPVRLLDKVITQDASNLPVEIFSSDIIYIGENHHQYGNHIKQLEIIKAVYEKKGKNIVVGLEMFSSVDQKALDNYISQKTDEITFLKESRYFIQWGYDYVLYREILRFCREEGIRVLGLNAEKRIAETVYRNGLAKLTLKELKKLPAYIEFENERYIERLYNIYHAHSGSKYYDFRNFYLAQLIWDETMAENIAAYLTKKPEATMIVLAGNGHIEYGDGIPGRVERRVRKRAISILLNSPYDPDAADYFIYTNEVAFAKTPMLGVYLEESENRLKVKGFTDKTAEDSHFLKKDDVILKINGAEIKSIADVRIALYQTKTGDEVTIDIIREGTAKTVRGPLPSPKILH